MSTDGSFRVRARASAARFAAFRWDSPYAFYLSAFAIFAASRAVVIAGVKFGELLYRDPDPTKWDVGPAWYHRLMRWDAGHYIAIATNGYQYSPDTTVFSTTAFYPLYPLLGRWLAWGTGLEAGTALLLIANVSSLIAALLMAKFVKEEAGEEIALWSVAFYFFFPSTYFLSAGYTEPLCLVFVLLSLMSLRRDQFLAASFFAGLALATRSVGIVLLPVILVEIYRHRSSTSWQHTVPTMALATVLATSGLMLYMIYLGATFGDPLAFASSQSAWHKGTFLSRFLNALTLGPLFRGESVLVVLVLAIWAFWLLRLPISLYALGTIMLPYLTLGVTVSMNRFVLMCFPAAIVAAILCRRRPILACTIIAICSALLLKRSALFSQWYWTG